MLALGAPEDEEEDVAGLEEHAQLADGCEELCPEARPSIGALGGVLVLGAEESRSSSAPWATLGPVLLDPRSGDVEGRCNPSRNLTELIGTKSPDVPKTFAGRGARLAEGVKDAVFRAPGAGVYE